MAYFIDHMITGFADDRTASIITDDTAAVNNIISF